ncbi:MAG TPA: RNA polymerase sigma factor [Ktedonobacterales bacterium]
MHEPVSHPPGEREEPPEGLEGLVALARGGDRAAFAALFHHYNARICTYLTRLTGNRELGRDLAQDTFLSAWRALPGMPADLRFEPWLYRIATNTARSHQRRARLIAWLPWAQDEGTRPHATQAGPEERAGETERVTLALAQLAPRCRACLLLQVEGGFSQREIAELLGISEKSVSAYVSRGRERFRQAYAALENESERAPEPERARENGGADR